MKEEKLGQEPAFPTTLNQVVGQTTYNFTDENGNGQIGYYNNCADISYQGVSKRVYAAIKLRVPESGEPWLDGMIRKSNRREAAMVAMKGLLSNSNYTYDEYQLGLQSFVIADELLKSETINDEKHTQTEDEKD